MKLELKHLAPYLPYGLEIKTHLLTNANRIKVTAVLIHDQIEYYDEDSGYEIINFTDIKPILRPLSDLTKEIEHDGRRFVPANIMGYEKGQYYLMRKPTNYNMSYNNVTQLLEWHFDVFGLIDNGLAININEL